MMIYRPIQLAHVVLRTRQIDSALDDFRQRKVDEPVSPIRGAISDLL